MIIDSINAKSDFYGSVVIGDNLFDIWLKEFTVGGFHDNGNRIELSYNLIPDMAPHKDGNAYLLVDRNGQGNFQGSVDYYLADEVDIHRKKIIFNNILWDNDNNNSDVFTFGFNQVNLHPIIKRPALDDNPDPDLTDEIKVYYHDPSDFSKLIVMIQTIKPTPAKILIYDISGRLISTQELLESAGTRYEEISLPNNGVYVVRVVTNEMRVTQKVISKIGRAHV